MGRRRSAHRSRDVSRDVVALRPAVHAWFKISLQSFGGPAGQISVMHRELVEERRWIGEERFLHALSFCTLLPGPEAQQLAVYLGWLLNGTTGGLIAGILFVLPGYIALMVLSVLYARFGDAQAMEALFAGVAPAVVAIVAQAVWRVGGRALRTPFFATVAVGAFAALFAFETPFPLVIATAGVLGFAMGKWRPDLVRSVPHASPVGVAAPLVADDALHRVAPSAGRSARVLALGLVLWGLPVLAFALALGRDSIFVQQGMFFSGTALVTFGGAYAVLAHVAQRAVSTYHWLLPGEMVRGLAMAETTPGPLIQVVQFVAFLGAYRNPGSLNPWVAAVVGATLVTWVTYVPCFLFIFLGAPYVEGLRANRNLSAALAAISAAVVGIIANLGVFFATHTLFATTRIRRFGPVTLDLPQWTSVSPRAVGVACLALFLLFKLRWSVLRTLAACAVTGASVYLLV